MAHRLLEAERTVWGFDHCQVGEQLARQWQLPAMLRRCMSLHHQCDHPEADAMVWLVHVSHALAHALDLLQEPQDQVPDIQVVAWDGLRLDWSDSGTLLSGIEERYQLACQKLMN
ncbi:MAG: HDOD domain-containing protein [Giesbergeria sp.]